LVVTRPPIAEPTGNHDGVFVDSPTDFVVDPDPVRGNTVENLLLGDKLAVQVYPSEQEFFLSKVGSHQCLVFEWARSVPQLNDLKQAITAVMDK
jgi:hypothetical protein